MKSFAVGGLLMLCSIVGFSQSVIQAEDAALFSAYIRQDHAGYNGSGYAKPDNKTGAYMEFVFRRTSAATDTILVRYANGGSSRNFAVTNNGSSVGTFSFTSTGSWTTWSNRIVVVSLQAGINRLRFTTTTNTTSYPVVDQITINGQAAVTMFGLTLTKSGSGSVSAFPVAEYHDAGTFVELSATASGGGFFKRWMGANDSPASPYNLLMNGHKKVVGVFLDTTGVSAFVPESGPRGFASVNALGNNGTTGGAGGDEVTVTTGDDLKNLLLLRADANRTVVLAPLTIYVVGTLTPGPSIGSSKMVDVKDAYDISIIGVGQDAMISGFGLNIVRSINIIVRGIKFTNIGDDGISVDAGDDPNKGHHIWIDHCTFEPPGYDGALDITHAAAYVTVSWNHFNKWNKNSLVGHSNSNTADVNLKVTYHHNYFDSTAQRNPRVRFGKVHVFNNYYRKNALYGVSSNMESDVLVEGNYFVDVPVPTETSRDGSPQGDLVERYNIFVNCGTPGTRGTAFEATDFYAYALDSASTIPQKVSTFSGSRIYDFSFNASAALYTLAVNAVNGSVTKDPDQPSYPHGTNVQLTATPSLGYHFVNWSGDVPPSLASNNPLTLTMDGNKTVTANFTDQLRTLSITASNGTVTKVPDLASYPLGSSVQLTANPNSGFFFVNWSGDVPSGQEASNPLVLVMDANKSLTAHFSDQTFTLTTNAVNGSINRNPNQAAYNNGANVELTAVPDAGYHFVEWSGDVSGSTNPVNLLMNDNKNVTATFAINQYTIGITAVNGTVSKTPNQATYEHGTNVSLAATPNGGYVFSSWSGDVSGTSNPINVLMNANKSVTANFTSIGLIATSNGTGGGAWTSTSTWAGGVVPTSNYNVVIAEGDSVYVTSAVTCTSLTVRTGGILSTTATITVTAQFVLEADAFYYHGASGTFTLPGGSKILDDASTVVYNSTAGSTSMSAGTFGNLIIRRGGSNTNIAGVVTINGDLTLENTSGSAGLRGTSGSTSRTNTVHGNVYIYGGTLSCADNPSGSSVAIWNIDGDVLVSGTTDARLSCFSSGGASTTTAIYNIGGDLTIAGGRLQYATNNSTLGRGIVNLAGNLTVQSGSSITDNSSTGPYAFNFVGTGVQTVTLGMNFSMNTNISDTVRSTSTVVFDAPGYTWGSGAGATGRFVVDGTLEMKGNSALAGVGGFQLNSGGLLRIGSEDGLATSAGNILVTGTRMFSEEATYEYTGTANQITGTSLPATIENLVIGNPHGVLLSAPATVTGGLFVEEGWLDLNANTITLGGSAQLHESPGATVRGSAGSITTTRNLASPNLAVDIGGLGIHIGSSANLGSTVLSREHGIQAGAGTGSVERVYNISPATNSGLNASVIFRYDESELNGNAEGALVLYRSTDSGTSWTQQGGIVNPSLNTITLGGIDGFSLWTAAEGDAVAAAVLSPGSINFDSVYLAQTKFDTITLTNVGSATLFIDSATAGGDFSIVSVLPDSLNSSNSAEIVVAFAPTVIGLQTGTFVLYSNAPTSPDTVTLSGTGASTTVNINVPVSEGWNLISNPVSTASDSMVQLFPMSALNYAYGFESGSGYQLSYTLAGGKGYWSKFDADSSSAITGTVVTLDTVAVTAGWNIIGSISSAVDTTGIVWSPANSRGSLYYEYNDGYDPATSILPGRGYWVKANAAGYLILSATAPPAPANPAGSSGNGLNSITITDANGARQTLFLRQESGDVPLTLFELPPRAPEGAFDVRFESDRMMEELPSDPEQALAIMLSSAAYPVTLAWDIVTTDRPLSIEAGTLPPRSISGAGAMTISDSRISRIVLGARGVEHPVEFSLLQNYPNPFNPATRIQFSVAIEAPAVLKVFNVLGQHVVTLFNGVAKPGELYEAGMDASGLASGVYFYELQSGPMRQVKKLTIMK